MISTRDTCEAVQARLVALRDGEIADSAEAALLTAHIAACPACAREWAALDQLNAALEAGFRLAENPADAFTQRVLGALAAGPQSPTLETQAVTGVLAELRALRTETVEMRREIADLRREVATLRTRPPRPAAQTAVRLFPFAPPPLPPRHRPD